MDFDEQWEEIAKEAIRRAEHVKCSKEAFLDGLEMIEDLIRERREIG